MVWLFGGIALLTSAFFMKLKYINIVLAIGLFAIYFDVLNQDILPFIIFIFGIVFLIIELYIPDFGITGIIGTIAMIIGLSIHLNNFYQLMLIILASMLIILVTAFGCYKAGKRLQISPDLVLNKSFTTDAGYSTSKAHHHLLNHQARVVESLRPVGKARFADGEVYEVLSQEGLIEAQTDVYVHDVKGSKIYVRKVQEVS